jgi:glycolate oxidase iron-sulfur subunit
VTKVLPTHPATARAGPLAALDYSVLQQCMHCGLCLSSCPTYQETKRERNSPRGRIALMRAIADRELAVTSAFGEEMSYCVGCLACTSACPAGVNYAELLETARAEVEQANVLSTPRRRALRWFGMQFVATRPRVLRAAGRMLRVWQQSGAARWLPAKFRELEAKAPRIASAFSDELIAPVTLARGPRRFRVLMLTGCVQDLAYSDVNAATVDVLAENGCDVLTPRTQSCCGSLHAHNGDLETARALARRHLDAVDPASIDAIISNAGGCGSHLRHYDRLLADDVAYADRAAEWSRKLRDIHEWLVEIGFRPPRAAIEALSVTYHESCHLCHGQRVSAQPRAVLQAIPGVQLRECAEAQWCCGSAGIYTLTQPETAARLQQRKVQHVRATGAAVVATANPGCHLQIEQGLRAAGDGHMSVTHPIVLLARAYAAERAAGAAKPLVV